MGLGFGLYRFVLILIMLWSGPPRLKPLVRSGLVNIFPLSLVISWRDTGNSRFERIDPSHCEINPLNGKSEKAIMGQHIRTANVQDRKNLGGIHCGGFGASPVVVVQALPAGSVQLP